MNKNTNRILSEMIKRKSEVLKELFDSCCSRSKSQKKEPEIQPVPNQPEVMPPDEPETNPFFPPDKEHPSVCPEIKPNPCEPEMNPQKEGMLI